MRIGEFRNQHVSEVELQVRLDRSLKVSKPLSAKETSHQICTLGSSIES